MVKKCFLEKALFAIFCRFMASLQMQFSQSSAHVESFLIPFLKTTRKNISKNGFGYYLTFSEVVTKCIFKKQFLRIFVSFLAQLFSVICLSYFVRWWGPERRAPNEGPKGPPMPSAGARRRGP